VGDSWEVGMIGDDITEGSLVVGNDVDIGVLVLVGADEVFAIVQEVIRYINGNNKVDFDILIHTPQYLKVFVSNHYFY
jgi:hypothetical protein